MKTKINWLRIFYGIGVLLVIAGTIDPMEGSVLILIGSIVLALNAYLRRDRHRRIFLYSFLLILAGVFFLFYISSLGGFGGKSGRSWWWGTLILPYPVGWLLLVITLIFRAVKKTPEVN